MTSDKKLIAIVGPTASGKTKIAVALAKKFDGEIVSADSRQVFRKLDIGTAKDLAEYGGVKYHLIDIKNPGDKFTLFDCLPLARAAIDDIFSRGKLPIVVGGTGLYVQALIEGFELEHRDDKTKSEKYQREYLEQLSTEQLQNILQKIDIKAYENLADKKNPRRLSRAIEKTQENIKPTKTKPDFDVLQIGINQPREILYRRIDRRVDERFEQGMLEEVIGLLKNGVDKNWLLKLGLEYRIMTNFLMSESQEFEAMKQELKLKSHQYAKRQETWFKRFPEIVWGKDYQKIEKIVEKYLN